MIDLSKAIVNIPYNDLQQLITDRNAAVTESGRLRQDCLDKDAQLVEANQKVVKLEAAVDESRPETGSVQPTG